MTASPSDPAFWRQRYAEATQGWEIGRAAPPLERWLGQHSPAGKRALVVGCGRGHEARLLARLGADVVAIDFAPEALDEARALALADGVRVDFRLRDLFALPKEAQRYQLVVEHCCFCAIEPARRGEYVDAVAGVLEEGGDFVGLLRTRCPQPDGPPFAVDAAEVERLFAPRFVLTHTSVPDDSIAPRLGTELLVHMRRR